MGPGLCPPPSSSGFREPSSCAHSVSESSVLATQTWPQHMSCSPPPGLAPWLPQTLPWGGLALSQHGDRTQRVDSLSPGLGAREMVPPSLKGVTCSPVEQPAPQAAAVAAGSFYPQWGHRPFTGWESRFYTHSGVLVVGGLSLCKSRNQKLRARRALPPLTWPVHGGDRLATWLR